MVGAAVLRRLVDDGHQVRALARSVRSQQAISAAGAAPVAGDLLDPGALGRLVAGCDWVFHVAGVNELCPADPARMWKVNVDGTRAIVEACARAGVGRLVHTSSAATIGERRGETGDEATVHRGWFLSEYERSKHRAEQVARGAPSHLDVVVVNPSSVQGPGRATGTGRLFLAAARGRLRAVIDTHFSIVDIGDCARGHLLAAERGRAGERYLLSGATLRMREALDLLGEVTGAESKVWVMPPALFSALAVLVEGVFRIAGRRPPMCRETARVLGFGHHYDGSRAAQELGLRYTPVENTLASTVLWFEEEGLLGRKRGTKSV